MASNPSGGARPPAFDQSLLAPIVRTKRTPMACVECRRRQVKCSGTTPRCERCKKHGFECIYMSLSEQRSTGGPTSRSGTPHAVASTPGQTLHQHQHQHHAGRSASDARMNQQQQQQCMQGFPGGAGYPAAHQGWHGSNPAGTQTAAGQYASQGGHSAQGYQMGYQQEYMQQQQAAYAARSQNSGGQLQPGAEVYAQGQVYGAAGEQAYAGGTAYNAYAHAVPGMDPAAYAAYQTAQMEGAAYGGQYAPQMYYDQTLGQMMAVDPAAAQQWAGGSQAFNQGHPGFSGQQ
ncbi:hypothetical protein C2E23DRAFT_97420 [Lenzites betulinus]|nr:hypothetical protein C2E23DRAFT_97420 [Lenzites betulinus]